MTGRIEEQTRVFVLDRLARYVVDMGVAIWSWMIRHAGWCIGRFHVRGSGQTPSFAAYGHNYLGEILPFAETRLARRPRRDG
eukprot:1236378-Pyramimonas_sp.AAC.1